MESFELYRFVKFNKNLQFKHLFIFFSWKIIPNLSKLILLSWSTVPGDKINFQTLG